MSRLVKCKADIAGATAGVTNSYHFLAPKGLYDGDVATATGITELATDATDIGEPVFTVAELIKTKKVQRLYVRSKEGNKYFTTTMLCSKDKVATVDAALDGKTLSIAGAASAGSTITSVVARRRATFY